MYIYIYIYYIISIYISIYELRIFDSKTSPNRLQTNVHLLTVHTLLNDLYMYLYINIVYI